MRFFRPSLLIHALLLVACNSPDSDTDTDAPADPYDVKVGPYTSDIRWTEYGIPHIKADDYGSLGFGMGYALARDHVCTLADQIIKVRSERARYFGPGENDRHLNSDFGWLALRVVQYAEDTFFEMPETLRVAVVGYAAGYNRYLEDTGIENLPPACRGQEWVKPITHIDLLAHYLHLGQFGSGYPFVEYIATAQPPTNQRRWEAPPIEALEVFLNPPIASNGWAIGSEDSSTGKGMLVSNTHFPDNGERQWHESHLTIPGQLNVYGASLVGVPLINIGFNEHVAWTHTVSNTPRFTVYQLTPDSNDPTAYFYDGQKRQMESVTHVIDVKQADGSLSSAERTLYRSHFGPMINAPVFGWSKIAAFTYRDVNEKNYRVSDTWFAMNHAKDLESFKSAHRDYMGIPWVHTMMADDVGNAFYADSAATPNLSKDTEAAFEAFRSESPYARTYWDYGLWVGDGSKSSHEWTEDPASPTPGAVPFDETPQLLRTDFVSNANENYWLANPKAPLSGFPAIYGPTDTRRTPRTKMNNRYLMDNDGRGYAGTDGVWDLEELESAVLDCTGSLADSLLDQVKTRCETVESVQDPDTAEWVSVEAACAALSQWDGTDSLDSVGAVLWREMMGSGLYGTGDLSGQGRLFSDAFDPNDPIYTPRILQTADDTIFVAMIRAQKNIQAAGFTVDTPLRDVQYRQRGEERIPVHGGPYFAGVIAVATHENGGNTTLIPRPEPGPIVNSTTDLSTEGYLVNNGNSWVMVMAYTEQGPVARAAMTYSQSEDPESPHFKDQTLLYAQETLRDVRFTEEQISSDPSLQSLQITLEAGSD